MAAIVYSDRLSIAYLVYIVCLRGFAEVSSLFTLLLLNIVLINGQKTQIRNLVVVVVVQLTLFSVTLPQEILDLTQKFMCDPMNVCVKPDQYTLRGIKQFYVVLDEYNKLETLMDISVLQSIIFCNTRRKVEWRYEKFNADDFTVSSMQAEMTKGERERVMAAFRNSASRILVTTNLLSCSIDIFAMHIFRETNLRCVGRSRRFGKKGLVITWRLYGTNPSSTSSRITSSRKLKKGR